MANLPYSFATTNGFSFWFLFSATMLFHFAGRVIAINGALFNLESFDFNVFLLVEIFHSNYVTLEENPSYPF